MGNKLVMGVGVNNEEYPATECSKQVKEYDYWLGMIRRCAKRTWKTNPSYTGTTCSENFKNYSFFYEWCQEQVGFGRVDENGKCWQLDKDILIKGNKTYSEDVCVFVPQRLNSLLLRREASRGAHLVGVYWLKNRSKFMAQCANKSGKQIYLGVFDDEIRAFQAYKSFKEAYIKEVASEYKIQIDERVYQALMNYTVEITD